LVKAPVRQHLPDTPQGGKVKGETLTDWSIWSVVERSGKQIGIERFGAHDLRRTCAKLCRKNGGDLEQIKFLLGTLQSRRRNDILARSRNRHCGERYLNGEPCAAPSAAAAWNRRCRMTRSRTVRCIAQGRGGLAANDDLDGFRGDVERQRQAALRLGEEYIAAAGIGKDSKQTARGRCSAPSRPHGELTGNPCSSPIYGG